MSEPSCVRQAICDRDRRVVGYEVLWRGVEWADETAHGARGLVEAFLALDLDLLAGQRLAYVTVDGALLVSLDVLPVPPERVVLQLDCGGELEPGTLTAAVRHARMGHAFAALDPRGPEDLDRLPFATIARVDVGGFSPQDAARRLAAVRRDGVALHAVGIEDHDVWAACVEAGADAFQGPFRELPAIDDGQAADLGPLVAAGDLLDPTADIDRLERVISRDLALTYGLLRYVNSAFFARRSEVGSTREAIAVLGERMTRRWALVVALGAAAREDDAGLLADALVRARLLELLAEDVADVRPDHAFTVGLLSLLPGLVGVPMHTALDGMRLPDDLTGALLHGGAPYGPLLSEAVAYLAGDHGLGVGRLGGAYHEALQWLATVKPALRSSAPRPVAS